MDTADTSDDSLEELRDEVLDLVDLTDFQDFLEFCQKESFLDAVGERPVLQETLQQWNSQSSVLGQEKHGASQELLVELGASLHLVEWDDDVLEENDMFVSERDGETWNDTS